MFTIYVDPILSINKETLVEPLGIIINNYEEFVSHVVADDYEGHYNVR